jgi:hypothetical protein
MTMTPAQQAAEDFLEHRWNPTMTPIQDSFLAGVRFVLERARKEQFISGENEEDVVLLSDLEALTEETK